MFKTLALNRLLQLPATVAQINDWAEAEGLPKPIVMGSLVTGANADQMAGYQHLVGAFYGHTAFRFTGFGYVFPRKIQFWVEHWLPESAQAARSKRFFVPVF